MGTMYALSYTNRSRNDFKPCASEQPRQSNPKDLLVDTTMFTSALAFDPATMRICEDILSVPQTERLAPTSKLVQEAEHSEKLEEFTRKPHDTIRHGPTESTNHALWTMRRCCVCTQPIPKLNEAAGSTLS